MAAAKKTKAKSTTAKSSKKNTSIKGYKQLNLVDNIEIVSSAKSEDDEFAEETMKKPKKLWHIDIIKYIFENIDDFNNLTNYTLRQNFFMINRTFSIKYPQQAEGFNVLGINMAEAVKSWCWYLHKKEGYGTVPKFVFTKGVKKAKEEANKNSSSNEETIPQRLIEEYCKHYKLSLRDYKDMLEFFKEQTIEDIKNFEKSKSAKLQEFIKTEKDEN